MLYHRKIELTAATAAGVLISSLLVLTACSPVADRAAAQSPNAGTVGPGNNTSSQPVAEAAGAAAQAASSAEQDGSPSNQAHPVTVVVAGYINHGPLQPTVNAIKEVVAKYGDKVDISWVDLATQQGEDYFKDHKLSAHMNIIIDGTFSYQVNGKTVNFQWFEGQQWSRADLDAVLARLTSR